MNEWLSGQPARLDILESLEDTHFSGPGRDKKLIDMALSMRGKSVPLNIMTSSLAGLKKRKLLECKKIQLGTKVVGSRTFPRVVNYWRITAAGIKALHDWRNQ